MSQLPNELWHQIFTSLPPSTLFSVSLTSRHFHVLVHRALHQHLIFRDPRFFAQWLSRFEGDTVLEKGVKALSVGINLLGAGEGAGPGGRGRMGVVEKDGEIRHLPANQQHPNRERGYTLIQAPTNFGGPHTSYEDASPSPATPNARQISYVCSPELYAEFTDLIPRFTSIRTLEFKFCVLPTSLYESIHSLPSLRILLIENCRIAYFNPTPSPINFALFPTGWFLDTPPSEEEKSWDHSLLPIEELTLLNIEGANSHPRLLGLARAHNLRRLKFDSKAYVARLFSAQAPHPHSSASPSNQHQWQRFKYKIPENLERLEIRLPEKKYWPSPPESHSLIQPLLTLLSRTSRLTHLSLTPYISELPLPPSSIPNLRSYEGILASVPTLCVGREVKDLRICDSGKVGDVTDVLGQLARSGGHEARTRGGVLEMLEMEIPRWDAEILYAVTMLFPDLQSLHVRYQLQYGAPSEDFILGIGPHFISRTPKLHTFRMYSPSLSASWLIPTSTPCISPPHTPDPTTLEFDPLPLLFSNDSPPSSTLDPLFTSETGDVFGAKPKDRAYPEILKAKLRHERREDEAEKDLRSMVGCWDRYCPQLREVQLARGFVWMKTQSEPPKSRGKGWWMVVDGEGQTAINGENVTTVHLGKRGVGEKKWKWVKKPCEYVDGGREYI